MAQSKRRVQLPEVRVDEDRLALFHAALIRQAEDEPRIENLWAKQDEMHRAKRQQSLRAAWCEYHFKMQQLHLGLAGEHASKRLRLLLEQAEEAPLGIAAEGGGGDRC